MKIEQIESLLIDNNYVVKLTTETGLTGLGQTACWGYPEAVQSVVATFEKYLIGQDPFRIEHHWQHLYRMSPFRGNVVAGAISAIDIALWDIKGKHFDAPVWQLLGGKVRDRVRLHLLMGSSMPIDRTSSMAEGLRYNAKLAADEGFTAIKTVKDRRVGLQAHVLVETVHENTGDARSLVCQGCFLFHDRRENNQVFRRFDRQAFRPASPDFAQQLGLRRLRARC